MKPATLKFGDKVLEITDPRNVQPVSADVFTEARVYAENVTCLSFAAIIADGDAEPRAEITARIRLTMSGAIDLRNALDGLLKGIVPTKEAMN